MEGESANGAKAVRRLRVRLTLFQLEFQSSTDRALYSQQIVISSESLSSWSAQLSRGATASPSATNEKADFNEQKPGRPERAACGFITVDIFAGGGDPITDQFSAQVRSWPGLVPLATLVTGNGGRCRDTLLL